MRVDSIPVEILPSQDMKHEYENKKHSEGKTQAKIHPMSIILTVVQ